MKHRISATVDEEVIKIINMLVKTKNYRNKSHVIETAIHYLKEEENDKK
jgi:Arc/MetJ-type ribon-helix-helix transcriptional regulator